MTILTIIEFSVLCQEYEYNLKIIPILEINVISNFIFIIDIHNSTLKFNVYFFREWENIFHEKSVQF